MEKVWLELDTSHEKGLMMDTPSGVVSAEAPGTQGGRSLTVSKQTTQLKLCARSGCLSPVKKSTARYCSIRCCAQDPIRKERLRRQARRTPILTLAHQLSMSFKAHPDIEASLDDRILDRDDIPAGLQRLRATG